MTPFLDIAAIVFAGLVAGSELGVAVFFTPSSIAWRMTLISLPPRLSQASWAG